ncbi:MAG: hypothetical protein KU28_09130 [Sulfurovum sp. PC08-66]|nr:MAG: hypothetical protein KU28_09130 [Sulfurovum sp. PC08-66]
MRRLYYNKKLGVADETKKRLNPNFKLSTRWLFLASYAKHQEEICSDIDIAFKFKSQFLHTCDPWEYFNILDRLKTELYNRFKVKIDLFNLDSSQAQYQSPSLLYSKAYELISKGYIHKKKPW